MSIKAGMAKKRAWQAMMLHANERVVSDQGYRQGGEIMRKQGSVVDPLRRHQWKAV